MIVFESSICDTANKILHCLQLLYVFLTRHTYVQDIQVETVLIIASSYDKLGSNVARKSLAVSE